MLYIIAYGYCFVNEIITILSNFVYLFSMSPSLEIRSPDVSATTSPVTIPKTSIKGSRYIIFTVFVKRQATQSCARLWNTPPATEQPTVLHPQTFFMNIMTASDTTPPDTEYKNEIGVPKSRAASIPPL